MPIFWHHFANRDNKQSKLFSLTPWCWTHWHLLHLYQGAKCSTSLLPRKGNFFWVIAFCCHTTTSQLSAHAASYITHICTYTQTHTCFLSPSLSCFAACCWAVMFPSKGGCSSVQGEANSCCRFFQQRLHNCTYRAHSNSVRVWYNRTQAYGTNCTQLKVDCAMATLTWRRDRLQNSSETRIYPCPHRSHIKIGLKAPKQIRTWSVVFMYPQRCEGWGKLEHGLPAPHTK